MTTPDPSNEEAPATLSTLARVLLFISIVLVGFSAGYGVEEFMDAGDSDWAQIVAEVAIPHLVLLIVGYVLIEDVYRRKS